MATSVREFLESHALHERLSTPSKVGWNGQWPERVEGECRVCNARRAHRIWPSRVAGVTPGGGGGMLGGAGGGCGGSGPLVLGGGQQRRGGGPKSGQPSPPPGGRREVK